MTFRQDRITVSGARVTPEGWIRDKPILSRAGVFEYRRADGSTRREYRPPEEVFSESSMESLRAVPVTLGHPGRVDANNDEQVIGAMLSAGERQDMNLLGEVVIHKPRKIGAMRELSLGYTVRLDETPGTTEAGEKYDAIQRDIAYNHLAVVPRGRAGNARLRLDGDDAASTELLPERAAEESRNVKFRIDGIEYEAPPEVERAYTKAVTALDAEKARADKAEAERDTVKAALDAAKAGEAKLRQDAYTAAVARVALEATAKAHGVEFKSDTSDTDIRKAVVAKLSPEMKISERSDLSDSYVLAAYDLVLTEQAKRQDSANKQITAVNGVTAAAADKPAVFAQGFVSPTGQSYERIDEKDDGTSHYAYLQMVERNRNAWKGNT